MDKFNEEELKVPFGAKYLEATLCAPTAVKEVHAAVILTHGAGGDMNFKHLVSLAHSLASNGVVCFRFTCKGRSMGCRAAVALAQQLSDESKDAVRGVICLSFPLHPPGQAHAHRQRSEDLRMLPEHLRVLFVSGTEDNMCDRVLFNAMVKEMKAQVEVFWLQGGSHGLTVKGTSEDTVLDDVNLKITTWISEQED